MIEITEGLAYIISATVSVAVVAGCIWGLVAPRTR